MEIFKYFPNTIKNVYVTQQPKFYLLGMIYFWDISKSHEGKMVLKSNKYEKQLMWMRG
jgi:hypothetical protein